MLNHSHGCFWDVILLHVLVLLYRIFHSLFSNLTLSRRKSTLRGIFHRLLLAFSQSWRINRTILNCIRHRMNMQEGLRRITIARFFNYSFVFFLGREFTLVERGWRKLLINNRRFSVLKLDFSQNFLFFRVNLVEYLLQVPNLNFIRRVLDSLWRDIRGKLLSLFSLELSNLRLDTRTLILRQSIISLVTVSTLRGQRIHNSRCLLSRISHVLFQLRIHLLVGWRSG